MLIYNDMGLTIGSNSKNAEFFLNKFTSAQMQPQKWFEGEGGYHLLLNY